MQRAPRVVTIAASGDLLWHNTLWSGAKEDAARAGKGGFDFYPLLAGMSEVIAGADVGICHNEVPLAPAGGPYQNYPAFAAPPQTVDAVKRMGFDVCTTGSNHSLDQGFAGLKRTADFYQAAGIRTVGTARSQQEASTPMLFATASGVQVAVVEGTYGTNGIPVPAKQPWSVSGIDIPDLLSRARAARQAGADIVLVAIHAGEEYQTEPNAQQRAIAEKLTASADVDLVYGHHVHVVQPITMINGKWVAYGLGNMVAQHLATVPRGYEGITVRFTFTEGADGRFKVTRAEYLPTLVTSYARGKPARLIHITRALAGVSGPTDRLRTAQQRTRKAVHLLGNNSGLEES